MRGQVKNFSFHQENLAFKLEHLAGFAFFYAANHFHNAIN